MELSDLIAAVKSARTKGDLIDLVKTELSLDLNKNKTMKALRAEVLNGLGVTEVDEGEAETAVDLAEEGQNQAVAAVVEEVEGNAVIVTQPLIVPPAEPEKPAPAKTEKANRILRHKTTGNTFIWTPALSNLSDLEEV